MKYPISIYLVTKQDRILSPWQQDNYEGRSIATILDEAFRESTSSERGESNIKSILIVKQKCCHGKDGLSMLVAYAAFYVKGQRRPDDKNEYLEIEL